MTPEEFKEKLDEFAQDGNFLARRWLELYESKVREGLSEEEAMGLVQEDIQEMFDHVMAIGTAIVEALKPAIAAITDWAKGFYEHVDEVSKRETGLGIEKLMDRVEGRGGESWEQPRGDRIENMQSLHQEVRNKGRRIGG